MPLIWKETETPYKGLHFTLLPSNPSSPQDLILLSLCLSMDSEIFRDVQHVFPPTIFSDLPDDQEGHLYVLGYYGDQPCFFARLFREQQEHHEITETIFHVDKMGALPAYQHRLWFYEPERYVLWKNHQEEGDQEEGHPLFDHFCSFLTSIARDDRLEEDTSSSNDNGQVTISLVCHFPSYFATLTQLYLERMQGEVIQLNHQDNEHDDIKVKIQLL